MKCLIVGDYIGKRDDNAAIVAAETGLLEDAGVRIEWLGLTIPTAGDQLPGDGFAGSPWTRGNYREIAQHLRVFKPDIVHFRHSFPLASPSMLHAARQAGAAVVVTLPPGHGMAAPAEAFAAGHADAGRVPLVDRFVVSSDFARARCLRAGFPADRVVVKRSFVPEPPKCDAVEREPFVLYAGGLAPDGGIRTLLDAWRGSNALDVPLIVAGEGPMAPTVAAAGGWVRWAGGGCLSDLHHLMRRASLLVLPANADDPDDRLMFAAAGNGLPVLGARVGLVEELIDCGRTGFLVEPQDPALLAEAVRYAFRSPAALARMSVAVEQDYRTRFSPERTVGRMLDIYRDALRLHVA